MTWYDTDLRPGDAAGSCTPVVAGGVPMVLIRSEDGWWAIEDRCSHAGCAFTTDGEIAGSIAICDCHGSEFDIRSGEVLRPPARVPIRTFPVRVVGDRLEVRM